MAQNPSITLVFGDQCGDCGERVVQLPPALPVVADDFDWKLRDFDSFRRFMLEDISSRVPLRGAWAPADMEVMIVELLAAGMDRLSHALDDIQQERFLATARRPESVRRHLALIGFDATTTLLQPTGPETPKQANLRLEALWRAEPQRMEMARIQGIEAIRRQERMVTVADHSDMLSAHPLVSVARATQRRGPAWPVIDIAVVPIRRRYTLSTPIALVDPADVAETTAFHRSYGLAAPGPGATIGAALETFVYGLRMAGCPVVISPAKEIGIVFALSVTLKPTFYRSEAVQALKAVFSAEGDGFFAGQRLQFGSNVQASDLIAAAAAVQGVERVCLNRFKRVGASYSDQAAFGTIPLAADEIAVCDNLRSQPSRGSFTLSVHGGIAG